MQRTIAVITEGTVTINITDIADIIAITDITDIVITATTNHTDTTDHTDITGHTDTTGAATRTFSSDFQYQAFTSGQAILTVLIIMGPGVTGNMMFKGEV